VTVIGSSLPVSQKPKEVEAFSRTIKEFNRFSTPDRSQCPSLP
jgi:hypothetical protein